MMALFDEKRIVELYIENRVREGIEEGLKDAEKLLMEKAAAEVEKRVMEKVAAETEKRAAEKAASITRKTAEGLLKTGKLSIEEIAACIPELSSEDIRGIQKTLTYAK